jgi:LPXTG-site transpeptidase (sortase) family protein
MTKSTPSILSLPPRALAVWLLGRLSVVLSIALVALPVLFALELMVEARRGQQEPLAEAAATAAPTPSRKARSRDMLLDAGPQLELIATPVGSQDVPVVSAGPFDGLLSGFGTLGQRGSLPASQGGWLQLAEADPTETPSPSEGQSEAPTPVIGPTPTRTPDPESRPVQIQIPAIGVKRSIVELPQVRDPTTGAWTQDLDVLFREGRRDLVGHWAHSANPGQGGNTILVGHNYGYGYKGVFLKLGRLKPGEKVNLVNARGVAFTYQVSSVQRVPWRRKNAKELVQHSRLLTSSGGERLTLVTCGGANVQPFPIRIYVIAEPFRDG